MAATFAALEAKVNDAAIRRIANATAIINGVAVDGILSNEYTEFSGVIGGSNPTFMCKSADIASVANGTAISINSVNYLVAGAPQPDGTGMTLLQLRVV